MVYARESNRKFVESLLETNIKCSQEVTLRISAGQKKSRENLATGYLVRFMAKKESDHEGIRTLNLPIRSRTPYPLGHAASHMILEIFNSLHSGKNKTPFL